jgi:hypothetical protein
VLQNDTTIAGVVRFLGWCGMIGVVAWFLWSGWNAKSGEAAELNSEGERFTSFAGK